MAGVLLGSVLALAPALDRASAGDGSITAGSPHDLNLSVALLFADPDPDAWRPLFSEASKLLYNATEKQMRLGYGEAFQQLPTSERLSRYSRPSQAATSWG